MRIPFDGKCLEAIVEEIQYFLNARVQKIVQPIDHTIALELYAGKDRGEGCLLLSCHPESYRAHFITARLPSLKPLPGFCSALRARLGGARLVEANQIAKDRMLQLIFESENDEGRLIGHSIMAEFMGKHSHLVLIDENKKIISAAHFVKPSQSIRSIVPGGQYKLPPVVNLSGEVQCSPFYKKLVDACSAKPLERNNMLVVDSGAYPFDLKSLGLECLPRKTLSIALEQFHETDQKGNELEQNRAKLNSQLIKTLNSRKLHIENLSGTIEEGAKANGFQEIGQLLLAQQPLFLEGAVHVNLTHYDGTSVQIPILETESAIDLANQYFVRARKAKNRLPQLREQLVRIRGDLIEIERTLSAIAIADELDLERLKNFCIERKWIHRREIPHSTGHLAKEDRPFEGHRIREVVGPLNFIILYGETAEANDYLSLRVAKPNDYWLHVRGGTSAHVVITTQNQPQKVTMDVLNYAAAIAASHSPSKHSKYVAVDYTLKKYVRKPRGTPKGTVVYTHEKTIHVGT